MVSAQTLLLSPAELAYLHTSLSLPTPIRPDGRKPSQFRPVTAETGILPGTNGSARVCFADGTEAIVGVKAEIEKTAGAAYEEQEGREPGDAPPPELQARDDWLEITVEIPGSRDDDPTTVFLASMLSEALTAGGEFAKKLLINRRFHWKLYLDIFLISPPLSYPLPLLSFTTHLALLSTRLPCLKSEGDEDPMFDDDWEASTYLYPRDNRSAGPRPPITLLVISVGDNVFFDPAREELAVADAALAISVCEQPRGDKAAADAAKGIGGGETSGRTLALVAMRSVDPPSRLTPPGIPNADNPATGTSGPVAGKGASSGPKETKGVWKAPVGGVKYGMMQLMIRQVLEKGGVADEVLDGIDMVDLA